MSNMANLHSQHTITEKKVICRAQRHVICYFVLHEIVNGTNWK